VQELALLKNALKEAGIDLWQGKEQEPRAMDRSPFRVVQPLFVLFAALFTMLIFQIHLTPRFSSTTCHHSRERAIETLSNLPQILLSQRALPWRPGARVRSGSIDAAGYHANLAIHAINIAPLPLLLYTLRLINTEEASARRLGALVALIFAAHPIQTQSVVYIVQRMESLMSLFYLLALLFLVRASKASSTGKRVAMYSGVGISYLLAFHSKEVAYTLPAAVLLYDFCFIAKGKFKGIAAKWPMYAILAVFFAAFTITTVMPLGGFGDLSDESSDAKYAAPKVKAGLGTKELDYSAGFKVSAVTPKEYLTPSSMSRPTT
jgi:hypothetical protein